MQIPQIITAKALAVAYNNGTRSSGANPLSTTGRLKIDNRCSQDRTGASNLKGGFDRPNGIRELAGYAWAWGDLSPVFPNDLFDLSFTLDGLNAVQIASGDSSYSGVRCRGLDIIVEPYEKNKKNLVYYIINIGGAGNDFSAADAVPSDTSTPQLLSTKSLGVQFGYWSPTAHALVWSEPCYFTHMRLSIEAVADADWSSCLNGIAYFPAGTIDWKLQLGQRTNRWPIPVSPNAGLPYMLANGALPGYTLSQPPPSVAITNAAGVTTTGPGSLNSSGDLAYPDLDSVVGIRMATQVNADLSFKAYWQLLYGMLDAKSGEFDHDNPDPLQVAYVYEKCGSPSARTNDTGYDAGSISYVNGGTTQFWP